MLEHNDTPTSVASLGEPSVLRHILTALASSCGEDMDANLARFLKFRGGQYPVELRALDCRAVRGPRVAYCWTADAVLKMAHEADSGFNAVGIYLIPGDPHPQAATRLAADQWHEAGKGDALSDRDIARMRVVYIDLDVERPSGTSSTTKQWRAAMRLAANIYAELAQIVPTASLGVGSSGNGAQVHIALDIAPSPEVDASVAYIMHAAANLWGGEFEGVRFVIDQTVKNRARLCPLFGTAKRKGQQNDALQIKHRRTAFVCSDEVVPLTLDGLSALQAGLISRLDPEQRRAVQQHAERPSHSGSRSTASAPRSSPLASDDNPWDDINAVPIVDVARALGLNVDDPSCPWCGQRRQNASQIAFGFRDVNLFKCQHGTCNAKATNCVGLIGKVLCGEDAPLSSEARRQVLSWAQRELGVTTRFIAADDPSVNYSGDLAAGLGVEDIQAEGIEDMMSADTQPTDAGVAASVSTSVPGATIPPGGGLLLQYGSEAEIAKRLIDQLGGFDELTYDEGSVWRYSAETGTWHPVERNSLMTIISTFDGALYGSSGRSLRVSVLPIV